MASTAQNKSFDDKETKSPNDNIRPAESPDDKEPKSPGDNTAIKPVPLFEWINKVDQVLLTPVAVPYAAADGAEGTITVCGNHVTIAMKTPSSGAATTIPSARFLRDYPVGWWTALQETIDACREIAGHCEDGNLGHFIKQLRTMDNVRCLVETEKENGEEDGPWGNGGPLGLNLEDFKA